MASKKEKDLTPKENQTPNQENNEQADGLVFTQREHMVILHNNDNTFVEAVLDVLQNVFGLNNAVAMNRLMTAHEDGYAICYIHTKQECDRKVDEAEAYCQRKAGEVIEELGGRSMYYDELQFEVRERV